MPTRDARNGSVEFLGGETVPNDMSGYLVKSVAKGSPGDEAGLRGGTMVVTIGGQPVVLGGDVILWIEGLPATPPGMAKLRDHLAGLRPGAPIKVTVLRKGQVLELAGVVP